MSAARIFRGAACIVAYQFENAERARGGANARFGAVRRGKPCESAFGTDLVTATRGTVQPLFSERSPRMAARRRKAKKKATRKKATRRKRK
jgi:hypothetical protein